jgi:hypothetical protein
VVAELAFSSLQVRQTARIVTLQPWVMEKFQSLADVLGVPDPQQPERPVGDPPLEHLTAQEFCRAILRTPQYRESLLRRILCDELPPGIEAMLWDRAHGKLRDQVALSGEVAVTKVIREVIDAAVDDDDDEPTVH